ncbi:uncharacterized protein Z518_10162 [Rhinocladiella mackenziei CBS 650.93]|uniref:Fe2OG dioxygenase domain-containing protein n=1 Tax=Rhinocladiella mackenziei CBS 650.93 TaxID=1442369 RepID=A0A0D2ICY5_9EURO|nr:uncharacterized protein Z518_10162 [Rhinocladiella mackenziei CBS 650.93]KIX01096.1 hypothetical protein Z518_10162 [Rhinocladiella mackenziei CBS 650.93]
MPKHVNAPVSASRARSLHPRRRLDSPNPRKAPNTLRFLYYPTLLPDTDYVPEVDIRAGAHSDYGSIALLFTRPDQPGLEILGPDRSWASVPVFPPDYHSKTFPPVVVNIGDLLSYWTNGLLKSTIHRVVSTSTGTNDHPASESGVALASSAPHLGNAKDANGLGADRFSIAVFVQPHEDTELVPMPSPLVEKRAGNMKAKKVGHGGGILDAECMRTLTAGDYLSRRLQATYGNVYEREKRAAKKVLRGVWACRTAKGKQRSRMK